jgi:tetratricopeptide (TPR) repeat protein
LTGDEKLSALQDVLRSTRALLIFDNLETLSKEEQEAIADFLRSLPQGCKAIITSRRRGGEGAVWLRLEKIEWEAAQSIILNEIEHNSDLEYKMRPVESRWRELFDETNGSPLALVYLLGLMRVRATLTFDGVLDLLHGNRDQDLQNFIFQEASKDFTENDKTALQSLSFFVPSVSFEAWMNVSNLSRSALETTIDRLNAISIVDLQKGEERYNMHPITRSFVSNKLLMDTETEFELGMRFAKYWFNYAQQFGGDGSYKTFDRLEREWNNLEATTNWIWNNFQKQIDPTLNIRLRTMYKNLVEYLSQFLDYSTRWDEYERLNINCYDVLCSLNNLADAGYCASKVALINFKTNNTDKAVLWINSCTECGIKSGSEFCQALSDRIQALIDVKNENFDSAEDSLKKALAFFLEHFKENNWVSIIKNDLGGLEKARGRYDLANQYYTEALDFAKKYSDIEGQAHYTLNICELAIISEQWIEARKWSTQSMQLSREAGIQNLIAYNQYCLAYLYEEEGKIDLALSSANSALKFFKQVRNENLETFQEFIGELNQKILSQLN